MSVIISAALIQPAALSRNLWWYLQNYSVIILPMNFETPASDTCAGLYNDGLGKIQITVIVSLLIVIFVCLKDKSVSKIVLDNEALWQLYREKLGVLHAKCLGKLCLSLLL